MKHLKPIAISSILLWAFISVSTLHAEEPSVEKLIDVLKNGKPYRSSKAARSLGKIKNISPDAINALIQALTDNRTTGAPGFNSPPVSWDAKMALVDIGKPAVEPVTRLAIDVNNKSTRSTAIGILNRMGHVAQASAIKLEIGLKDNSESIRRSTVWALSQVQKDHERLVPLLRPLLSDKSIEVRSATSQVLGSLGSKASSCVPGLIKLLDDRGNRTYSYSAHFHGERPVRYDAAVALGKIGKKARPALPKLRKMMVGDDHYVVRVWAALSVARLDDDPSPALKVLIANLNDSETGTGPPQEAAEALGELGAKAKPAMPALTKTLKHPDTFVRMNAATAIAAIDPADAKIKLLPLLQDPDDSVRSFVIKDLGNLRLSSDDVIDAFISALDDDDSDVQVSAMEALGKLGPKASAALPLLRNMASEKDVSIFVEPKYSKRIREAAKEAIRKITKGQ